MSKTLKKKLRPERMGKKLIMNKRYKNIVNNGNIIGLHSHSRYSQY